MNKKTQHGRTDSYRVATVATVHDDNITADGFYKVLNQLHNQFKDETMILFHLLGV